MKEISKVGFIGVGNMGNPMAGHLVKAGFDVTVFDIRAETLQAFVAQHGGKAASSLAEVARGADVVITMLPNDKVVRKAILGDGAEGAAATLEKGAIVIDMSTSDPVGTRALAAALAPRGVDVLDAPVMGGVAFAKSATLDIMAGGDAALIERCRPLFGVMGHSLVHSGGIGTAHALKALANYVNACSLINAIEAMTIGKKFGLDANLMAEALIPMCTGRNHPIVKKVVPHVLTRKFGTGMAMGFIAKDLKIAIDTAHAIGAAAPLGEKVAELWNAAVRELGYDLDQTQIVRYWEEASGVSLAGDDLELLTKSKN
ncbi:MAG: NAD(P)-dependent oxidoreductase [Burkholderiales bacterium]|nr:NAD(P)-dependent oxidoreductase [Burkholderiales bacterium]